MMENQNKQKCISEFSTMKLLEQNAQEFYLRVSQNPDVKDDMVKHCFSRIAKDEEFHIELVDQILNIATNCS